MASNEADTWLLYRYVYDIGAGELVGQLGGSKDGVWSLGALGAVDPDDRTNVVTTSAGDTIMLMQLKHTQSSESPGFVALVGRDEARQGKASCLSLHSLCNHR